jgi:CoxE family protein
MVLGRYVEPVLPRSWQDAELDEALGYVYDREYTGRGHRLGSGGASGDQSRGGPAPSVLRAVDWLDGARRLFPVSILERLESDALTRYGLTELLEEPAAVDSIDTSAELGAALLRIKGTISPQLTEGLRALIARIVADIMETAAPSDDNRLERPPTARQHQSSRLCARLRLASHHHREPG